MQGAPALVFAHELSHLVSATSDPNNGEGATDSEQNANAWDDAGDTVRDQNLIATQLNQTDQIRTSYYATLFDDDSRYASLSGGISYTSGQSVSIVRFGDQEASGQQNNQDHTARLDNSADLIFGFGGDDYIHGGGGNDHLYGGSDADQMFGGLGDDRLFGEAGNDVLAGNVGADLLHGGFNRSVNASANLATDGGDEAKYDVFLAVASGLGIEIGLTDTPWSSVYATDPDFNKAVFVRDLARDNAVDTLISVETILATSSDDRFVITSFNPARVAGSDRVGGLAEIDFGQEGNSASQKGDVIDLSGCTVGAKVDLGALQPFVCRLGEDFEADKIIVYDVERVIGTSKKDELIGNGSGVILEGGDGNDIIHLYAKDIGVGGPGADKFYLYTNSLAPGAPGAGQDMYQNEVLILGLDAQDEIYIDGVKYTGFSESGSLEGGYYADEVGAWVYDYVETRTGSHRGGQGNEVFFGVTSYFNESELSSNENVQLNRCMRLEFHEAGGRRLKVDIAGWQPSDAGITFKFDDLYVDPPTYGSYTQHVGTSNGHNIDSPGRYAHNPDATYEELHVSVFNLHNWIPSLPTGMANYAGYVGMMG